MLRNINLVFIFLLLSIYSMKKLKSTQTECKLKRKNVANVSNSGMRNVFIADGKLYIYFAGKPLEIQGVNPKLAAAHSRNVVVIDTEDKLRLVTYPTGRLAYYNVTSAETFPGTYSNLLGLNSNSFAIRKNDSAIMRLNKTELIQVGPPLKGIKQICGSKRIFLYTEDDYLATLSLDGRIIRKMKKGRFFIQINPNSALSCNNGGIFYGAKDDTVMTAYLEFYGGHFKTNRLINEKIISLNRNDFSVSILNDKNEWRDCPEAY